MKKQKEKQERNIETEIKMWPVYYNGSYWLDYTTGKISENAIVTSNLLIHLESK